VSIAQLLINKWIKVKIRLEKQMTFCVSLSYAGQKEISRKVIRSVSTQ
jgi:hypothetical protein